MKVRLDFRLRPGWKLEAGSRKRFPDARAKTALFLALAALVASPPTRTRAVERPAAPADAAPVHVETSVDRTAVWVGDRVTYTVRLQCAPRVEIVPEDLAADRLQTSGLDMLNVTADRDATDPERVVHRVRYTFATYRTDGAPLTIAEFPVRYVITRPGVKADAGAPAGEVRVPSLSIALRSTVAESDPGRTIRDSRALIPLPRRVRLAGPVGVGLLLLAAAPVALGIADVVRRVRRSRGRRAPRTTRRELRASLDDIKTLDVRSLESRRDAYAQLDGWVRHRVREATGVDAAALTPPELAAVLPNATRAPWLASVPALLEECERARYSAEPPPTERWPVLVRDAEALLSGSAR